MMIATNWTAAWLLTGVGIGVVFCILILLVLVLQFFSALTAKNGVKPLAAPAAKQSSKPQPLSAASDADKAAVAVALYLYTNNLHDDESGVLTIHLNEHTAWHAVLNNSI